MDNNAIIFIKHAINYFQIFTYIKTSYCVNYSEINLITNITRHLNRCTENLVYILLKQSKWKKNQ